MCRTCRYIDPGPSFVFIGPPPSATRPVAAGRRLARPPLPAIRDLDRAPPPPSARPAPPSARPPLATGWAQPAGAGGGGARTPPWWHQLGEKRKCWLWGLKNRPPKIDASSIFAPIGAPFIFGQVLKKSRRSNEYFERYSQKTWGEGRICPPFPVRVLKLVVVLLNIRRNWSSECKSQLLRIEIWHSGEACGTRCFDDAGCNGNLTARRATWSCPRGCDVTPSRPRAARAEAHSQWPERKGRCATAATSQRVRVHCVCVCVRVCVCACVRVGVIATDWGSCCHFLPALPPWITTSAIRSPGRWRWNYRRFLRYRPAARWRVSYRRPSYGPI